METVINISVIAVVLIVVVYVQSFLGKEITAKEIVDTQKVLDELGRKTPGGIVWKDARAWLLYSQEQEKALTLLFTGMFLISILIILALVTIPSLTNIAVIGVSATTLICHGMIKMSREKTFIIQLLIFLLIIATLAISSFDKTAIMSAHTYFYLWGLVIFFGLFDLFRRTEKA